MGFFEKIRSLFNPPKVEKPVKHVKEKKTFNKERLKQELLRDEGKVNHAYKDSLGYWTIGIGRLIDKRKGGQLTDEECLYLLNNDIDRKAKELYKALPWLKNQPEEIQRALMNMAFQLGVGGLLKFKRTLGLIKDLRYNDAADNALKSLWARQTPNRAKRVTNLIRQATVTT